SQHFNTTLWSKAPNYICISNRSKLRVERVKDFLVRSIRSFERFLLCCSYTMSYMDCGAVA
ncbi:hypothetical protein, partial [Prevotella sp.]|uniref:hypothetical protein n=1 Tax=Prevotella sp. TaxID=59823 RepID=UPI0040290A60